MKTKIEVHDLMDKAICENFLRSLVHEIDNLTLLASNKLRTFNTRELCLQNSRDGANYISAAAEEANKVRALVDRAYAFAQSVWRHQDRLPYISYYEAEISARELVQQFTVTHWEPLRAYGAAE